MSQSLANLLVTLNVRLGDTNNFTFTSDEKTEALNEAFNDDLVVADVWDSSLTFDTSTYQYARPATIDRIQDIYIKPSNASDTDPQKISADLWEVVGDNIHFKNGANLHIPDNYVLYLRGKSKYTTSDSIVETNVQEYVLNLALVNCFKLLLTKKNMSFLKTDITVSEIVTSKREIEREIAKYRQRLPRAFEAA